MSTDEEKLLALLQNAVHLNTNKEDSQRQLAALVNYLIVHDFERLIRILYRVDVDEKKLKKILYDNPHTDAGILIANLLIERQLQKEQFKKTFPKNNSNIPDEDRWNP